MQRSSKSVTFVPKPHVEMFPLNSSTNFMYSSYCVNKMKLTKHWAETRAQTLTRNYHWE